MLLKKSGIVIHKRESAFLLVHFFTSIQSISNFAETFHYKANSNLTAIIWNSLSKLIRWLREKKLEKQEHKNIIIQKINELTSI